MSIFIDNKYTRWYYAIISNAQSRENVTGYVEKHHIIPKSLGGSNKKSNIVSLTAREHFICHRLLIKITLNDNKRKMIFALNMMLVYNEHQNRYIINSYTYQKIKEEFSKVNHFNDLVWQKQNGLKRRGKRKSIDARKKMSDAWTTERKKYQSELARQQMIGNIPWNKDKKCPQLTGDKNGFYGKTHSKEFIEKLTIEKKGINPPWAGKRKLCCHCDREFDLGNYLQYHGDKCKKRIQIL